MEAIRKLKQEPGQDILIYGSGELLSTLMPQNLIDEYQLMVFPVALGSGKSLFRHGNEKVSLKLAGAETTSTGVAVLTYESAG